VTAWERRILEVLAERYPSAAAASGGRALRLRPAVSFPELAAAGADSTESFLEAAEKLEKEGVVSLVWEKHRKGEVLKSLTLENTDGLFSMLGLRSPVSVLEAARATASSLAAASSLAVGDGFFDWLSGSLRPEDAAAGIDAESVRALGLLAGALPSVSVLTPRALSVRLFSDSKYLENLLYRTRFLFQRAEADGITPPDFSPFERSFPETMIAGRFILDFADSTPLENATGMIVGLPAASARLVRAVRILPRTGQPPSVLSVENKETFYALSSALQSGVSVDFDCILYTAGHPNPAVCAMLGVFARSGFSFFHAGDLDPDGIIILQEVMRAAGCPVRPVGMDAAVFDRYLPFARDLTAGMLSRFMQLADETRSLAGIELLVERILSTGKGVEQEIIDYSVPV